MTDFDVIVVGGGPSGLVTAAEVARTGARVLLAEKRDVEPIPRAGTLLPRPLELFDARGIADRFISRTCELNPFPFVPSHIWGGMGPVDWSQRDSRFRFTLYLSQHETEAILQDWALECGVTIRHRWEVTDFTQDEHQVTVTGRDAENTEHILSSAYLVGADGGRSLVRTRANIAFPGQDSTFTGVIATAELEFPWQGGIRVEHNERGWVLAFPFGPGLTRFTMVHADGRYTATSAPVTREEMNECLSEIFGETVTIPSLHAASRYGDAMRMADQFREGRVFFVGESARIHYPASGMGMQFCIQDAFNLGWKLGAVLAGHANTELLNTYETERRPVARDLFESVDAQVAIQFDFSQRGLTFTDHFTEHFLPDPGVTARLCDELNGTQARYPAPADSHPSVGHPVPDFDLLHFDGSSSRLYEQLRDGTFVLFDFTDFGALRDLPVPSSAPVRVVEAQPARQPPLLTGVRALLVRPDTYAAWATASTPEPADARRALNPWLALSLTP